MSWVRGRLSMDCRRLRRSGAEGMVHGAEGYSAYKPEDRAAPVHGPVEQAIIAFAD